MLGSKRMKIRVAKKSPDTYQHGDLREALVQAGLKLLSEGGLERLSLRAAAQLAGVSHAAPYRHYRDKDALVAAIAERGFRLLSATMRAELEQDQMLSASETVTRLGLGYIAFATQHPAYLQVMFGGALSKADAPSELLESATAGYLMLRDAVVAGMANAEFRKADPDEVALACWSMVHGVSGLVNNGAFPSDTAAAPRREQCARLLRHLGHGIDSP